MRSKRLESQFRDERKLIPPNDVGHAKRPYAQQSTFNLSARPRFELSPNEEFQSQLETSFQIFKALWSPFQTLAITT